jgi:cytochrome bd-type quinol oxidase subunit 2
MSVRAHLPGYRWFHVFRNAAIRIGVYVAVGLILVFTTWLFLANRAPFLDRLALERNIAAAFLLCLFALIPILRFMRMPGHLLASGLVAWLIFSSYYRVLCVFFRKLGDWHGTIQVFMFGAVVYLIVATVSWIGVAIWRVREAHVSHPNNHAS